MSSRFWKGRRVLVIGGAGFIGSHAVDALVERGAKVSIADNLSTGRRENCHPRALFQRLDTDDASGLARLFRLKRPEFVLNFAALVHVPLTIQDPRRDAKSITGLINVLDNAVKFKVKKVFHASSGFIYGNARRIPTPESEPAQPLNPYSISKAACEHYLRFYNTRHGLPFAALRFSVVYGPRRLDGAIPYYLKSLASGRAVEIYGKKTRDLIFVHDAVEAILLALRRGIGPQGLILNIGSGRETTLSGLHALLAELMDRPNARPCYLPGKPGEVNRMCLDIRQAKRVLGFSPRTPLRLGLQRTVEWFRQKQARRPGRGRPAAINHESSHG